MAWMAQTISNPRGKAIKTKLMGFGESETTNLAALASAQLIKH